MKQLKVMGSVLLVLVMSIILLGNALALTSTEKENMYSTALEELESYLESPEESRDGVARLNAILADLEELGNYNFSKELSYYAFVLLKIEENDFSDWHTEMYLESLCLNEKFVKYTKDECTSAIAAPEELQNYYNGRMAESQGDNDTAIACYAKCISFFDAMERRMRMTESLYASVYQKATELMNAGKLEEAYAYFMQCRSYADAEISISYIIRKLGYEPGKCGNAHTWEEKITKAATCNTTGEKLRTCMVCGKTETVTIAKDSTNHTGGTEIRNQKAATCTAAGSTGDKYCKGCNKKIESGSSIPAIDHQWKNATYETPKTCKICGKTEGKVLPRIEKGDIFIFGVYEQDNNTANGKEPVEWLVLYVDKNTNRALLISKYALDCKQYHTAETDITWEKSSLRAWLNNEFIKAAFSAEERKMIPTVTVSADKNPDYRTAPGNATQDKVFMLSITEINKYVRNYTDRKCIPTAYAVAQNAYKASNGNCWWWLRSPGIYGNYAACVNYNGAVNTIGSDVVRNLGAVRPALYIDLNLIP